MPPSKRNADNSKILADSLLDTAAGIKKFFGDEAASWARSHHTLGDRLEVAGDTAFFYCRDPAPLLAALADAPALRYLHRAASLEDVFIKLTGRELRD